MTRPNARPAVPRMNDGIPAPPGRGECLAAEYFPVWDVTRTGNPHVAYGHHARAEGNIAFYLESAAAAQ